MCKPGVLQACERQNSENTLNINLFDAAKFTAGCVLVCRAVSIIISNYGESMTETRKIMIVAGESSGDTHAAKLVRQFIDLEPETKFEFFGAAGPKMREVGVEAVVRSDNLSVVGLAEIGRALPIFLRAFRELKNAAVHRRPDAVILVDFPEFNLKLAKALKKLGLLVIYYISPQLWAWRKYRISAMKKYIDLMITILPFEKEWYARNGFARVEYVGSPLSREVRVDVSKTDFCRNHGLEVASPIIALLPGSRSKEIAPILPVMIDAAAEIRAKRSEVQFIVAAANQQNGKQIAKLLARSSPTLEVKVILNETYDLLNAADAAAIASGTATMEAGIIGTPMVVVYKTSKLNYRLFEPMIDVEHYGLINLIAEERVAVELIQHDFTASATAAELSRLLEPSANATARSQLKAAADKLGHGGASKRAAEAILGKIDATQSL